MVLSMDKGSPQVENEALLSVTVPCDKGCGWVFEKSLGLISGSLDYVRIGDLGWDRHAKKIYELALSP